MKLKYTERYQHKVILPSLFGPNEITILQQFYAINTQQNSKVIRSKGPFHIMFRCREYYSKFDGPKLIHSYP